MNTNTNNPAEATDLLNRDRNVLQLQDNNQPVSRVHYVSFLPVVLVCPPPPAACCGTQTPPGARLSSAPRATPERRSGTCRRGRRTDAAAAVAPLSMAIRAVESYNADFELEEKVRRYTSDLLLSLWWWLSLLFLSSTLPSTLRARCCMSKDRRIFNSKRRRVSCVGRIHVLPWLRFVQTAATLDGYLRHKDMIAEVCKQFDCESAEYVGEPIHENNSSNCCCCCCMHFSEARVRRKESWYSLLMCCD